MVIDLLCFGSAFVLIFSIVHTSPTSIGRVTREDQARFSSDGGGCPRTNCTSNGSGSSSSQGSAPGNLSNIQGPPGGPGTIGTRAPVSPSTNLTAAGNMTASRYSLCLPPNPTCTHYYYGGSYLSSAPNYTQSSGNAVQIMYVSIFIPSPPPLYGDYYSELLSTFDNLGWYDQIGVTDNYIQTGGDPNDTWAITWDQVDYQGGPCPITTHSHAGATYYQGLQPYSWYTFFMYLSGTHLEFRVYPGAGNMNGTPTWQDNSGHLDSATSFETNHQDTCAGTNYFAFTLFQEVQYLNNGGTVPPWNFFFGYTTVAWWTSGGWSDTGIPNSDFDATCLLQYCPAPPQSYYYLYYNGPTGRIAEVANLAFREYFTYDTFTEIRGITTSESGADTAQGPYCPAYSCSVNFACNAPTSWGNSYATTGSISSFYSAALYWNFTAPSGAIPGLYDVVCTSAITSFSPQQWSTFEFYVNVI